MVEARVARSAGRQHQEIHFFLNRVKTLVDSQFKVREFTFFPLSDRRMGLECKENNPSIHKHQVRKNCKNRSNKQDTNLVRALTTVN